MKISKKTKYVTKKNFITFLRVLAITLLCSLSTFLHAANDDIFTAKTVEGVEMRFKIISKTPKTCQVDALDDMNYNLIDYYPAIDRNTTGSVTIPETVNGYSVISIGNSAFSSCERITTITIPNSVTTIGHEAFYKCKSITSIIIPECVISIGEYAFGGCNSLTSITMPNSVTSIGERAFHFCTNLTFITIPNTLKTIEEGLFVNCSKLTSVDIPYSVTSIGKDAFRQCYGLTSLTIPNSVTNIGKSAFSNCEGLISVIIPNSVISIEPFAFSSCPSLKTIKSKIKKPYDLDNVFYDSSTDAKLIVPYGTKNSYKYREGWKIFKNIEEESTPYCELTIAAVGKGDVSINGNTVRDKTSSYSVVEGSDVTLKLSTDYGYRLKSIKLNYIDVTSSITGNNYIISNIKADALIEVVFEAIPTYSLNITTTGNGSVMYNGTSVRDKTQAFTVIEGNSATVSFTPDAGYRIASVKLNNTDVTSSVVNNSYTINNIIANTTLAVTFEKKTPTTYAFTISAVGNGSVTYNSTVVRGKTQAFTVNEGTSATITFTPDAGYRIASVKLNGTDVTASVANNKYVISNITANMTLAVTFEAITHTISITSSGNGSAYFNNTTVRNKTEIFTVNEGTSATITFAPDAGYRIANVKVNGEDVTANVVSDTYTISNITANTTLAVTFEAIPPTTYTFNITASGNGTVTYNSTAVRGKTTSFTVNEGTSATITFTPDAGYRVASVKLNGTDVTASVADNKYVISNITANTTLTVTFEAITHTLSITALGNGYVAYDGNSIRGKTSSFSLEEGSNAVLKFSADNGNRLKSVKVNGQDVTSTIINNQYTINNITANTSVEVVFEAIPSYSLNIVASGNGNAVYNGMIIRNQSKSFTLQEGSSATISFTPDANYRIKSVKVNNTDVTSQVVNGQITISNIVQDTNVEVSFEEIPPTTYSLTITAIGNGAITYDGNSIRGGSSTFTVVEGSYVTVQITADDGYRLKRVTYNGNDVTASAVSGRFTTDKITANSTLVVEFEAIPTFSLTIKSSAFGCVKYGNAVITNQTETFTVREGASAVLSFVPDGNGRLQRITLDGNDITSQLVNGQYTISDIRADQSVEAEYVEDITKVTDAGVAYTVTSYDEGTVVVAAGNYGQVLTIPASFTAKGKTWTVTGIDSDALTNATELAAVIWEPEVPFTAQVSNPNLLLYVKKDEYAQSNVQNVVVGDQAENIVLTEAESGNNFYCPKSFIAKRISYEHNYSMISGYKDCQGWETLVLPFDVTMAINTKGTELVPYTTWTYGTNLRPFWLYQLTNDGWKAADGIKANVPYIISMPNNEMYESSYNLTGNIQFIGTNVEVKASDNMTTSQYGNKRLVANYQNQAASSDIYALNVSNEWHQNTATEKEGSTFIRALRAVHPFEAYLTVEGSAAGQRAIPIFDNVVPTAIVDVMRLMSDGRSDNEWYDLQGRKLQGEPTKNGLYINKGKKIRK